MKYRLAFFSIIAMLTIIVGSASCSGGNGPDISSVLCDEAGNTYAVWRMVRSVGDQDVYLTKISPAGEVLWNKPLFIGDNRRVSISGMVTNGNGGVFIGWEVLTPANGKEGRHYFDRHTLVNIGGEANIIMSRDYLLQGMQMASDAQGGILLYWITQEKFLIEKVDHRGVTAWEYRLTEKDTNLQFTTGIDGETFILWGNQGNPYMYVQKLDSRGQAIWGDEEDPKGIKINTKGGDTGPRMVSDGTGGVIISWAVPSSGGMISNIGTFRISTDGEVVFDESLCDLVSPTNGSTRFVSDDTGGGVVIWEDHREGMGIFAQKVNAKGQTAWQQNGVPVCTGLPRISPRFEAVSDGLGGVIVVWLDGNQKLSVQRLDSSGQQQWGESGIQIAGGVDDQPIIFSGDNQHKMIVGWSANGKSCVQKVDAGGELLWGKNGIELSP